MDFKFVLVELETATPKKLYSFEAYSLYQLLDM
jgi:hypothetical protein